MNSNKNNIVWITGGSSGIGRAIAEKFASEGINIALSSRSEGRLLKLQSDLSNKSGEVFVAKMDITDSEQVEKVLKKINKKYNVNCLINNAGITSFVPAIDTDFSMVDKIISTNLLGAIYATQCVLPFMIERNQGSIININSVASKKIFTNSSVYSASKAGLLSYSNVLREELRGKNIKLINVFPGATKTPIWPNDILEKQSEKMMSPNDIAEILYNIYIGDSNIVAEEIVLRPVTGDL